jgi:hypothetical protein
MVERSATVTSSDSEVHRAGLKIYASRMAQRIIERVERAAESPTGGHAVHE